MVNVQEAKLNKRLAYLSEMLIAFSSSPIPSHLLQTLADYTHGAVPHNYLALALIDPDGDGYIIHSLGGRAAAQMPHQIFPTAENGLIGQTITSNQIINVKDLAEIGGPVTNPLSLEAACQQAGLAAALVVPLRQGNTKIGALFFAAASPYIYTDDDQQIASLLAAGLAAHLEMSRLYQTLADEQSTLKAVVESAQDGVVVVNPAGLVLLANPAFHRLFGLQNRDLTGEPLFTVIDSDGLQELFAHQTSHTAELKLANGRVMQTSLEPVVSRYGEQIGWAAVLHDITVLKELARMKDEFVNIVSHDLKNPINAILMANDLLVSLGELNDSQANLQSLVRRTAVYMDELVTDLLDLGRLETGLGLDIMPFDLVELIKESIYSLEVSAEEKMIALTTTLPEQLTISGDMRRLRQALLNIVGNAIKYTPAHGTVAITLTADSPEQPRPFIRITVQDNGLGIPTADLPHIFDKFYRVESKQTLEIQGTGLGLAIAKSIVEAHEGQIRVASQEGEGSTFTILLPHIS